MWIKRTEAEIEEAHCQQWRQTAGNSAVAGFFVAVLVTIIDPGGFGAAPRGIYLVPPEEILRRLPFGTLAGIVFACCLYYFNFRKQTMVCLKCGIAKDANNSMDCSCGGTFEDILKLKWVEDITSETIKCLNCGTDIPATSDKCPKCEWSYKQYRPEPKPACDVASRAAHED